MKQKIWRPLALVGPHRQGMRNGAVYPAGLCDKKRCVSPNPGLMVGGFNQPCRIWCYIRSSMGKGARSEGNTRPMVKNKSRLSLGAQCYGGSRRLLGAMGCRQTLGLH